MVRDLTCSPTSVAFLKRSETWADNVYIVIVFSSKGHVSTSITSFLLLREAKPPSLLGDVILGVSREWNNRVEEEWPWDRTWVSFHPKFGHESEGCGSDKLQSSLNSIAAQHRHPQSPAESPVVVDSILSSWKQTGSLYKSKEDESRTHIFQLEYLKSARRNKRYFL